MPESLQEYYLSGEQIEDGSSSAPPEGYEPARDPQGPTIAHRTVDAGKQYEERRRVYEELENLLESVREGSELAMDEIATLFPVNPFEIQVTITKPLRDSNGKTPDKFGLKVINSSKDLEELMADYSLVAGYFPNLEIQVVPTTKKGKQLAVVMGITARDFNALVSAVRHRARLEREMNYLDQEIRKGRKEMNVEKSSTVVATGKEKEEVSQSSAPAQGSSASSGKGSSSGKSSGGKGGQGAAKG